MQNWRIGHNKGITSNLKGSILLQIGKEQNLGEIIDQAHENPRIYLLGAYPVYNCPYVWVIFSKGVTVSG